MQPMLSGVAVRGRIWHAAHALARDKSVLSSLRGKNQVDYYGEPRNFGHLFFQTLKRAHFLKSGRKKWYTFCVPMGGSGIYIYICIHEKCQTKFLKRVHLITIPGLPGDGIPMSRKQGQL